MIRFQKSIQVVLRPSAAPLPPPADIVLEVEMQASVEITGLGKASVPFTIRNPTAAPVSFSAVSVAKEGAWKGNVGVAVKIDNFTVPAGGTFQNFLDIESHEAPLSEETVTVTVSAEV